MTTDPATALAIADVASMKGDIADMKSSIKNIADALTKLAILEDRQSAHMTLMEKALNRLEVLEDKQHATELRFATLMIQEQKVTAQEGKIATIQEKLTTWEAGGKTIGKTAKVLWAVFGGSAAAGVGALIMHLIKSAA